jgi:hypothetical protein
MMAPMRAPPLSPPRLPLAGDAWVRFRRVPGGAGKVIVAGEAGRFLLLPEADFEALSRSADDPASPQRQRLADLGFVLGPERGVGSSGGPAGVWRHVVFLNGPGPGGAAAMSEATARSVVESILGSSSPSLRIELRGAEPLADPALLRLVVDLARAGSRSTGKPLSLALTTRLRGATSELCDFLIDRRVALCVDLGDAPPFDAAAPALRDLHARYAARGVASTDAFVNGLVTVTRATLAGGPEALVSACVDAGLAFVQLRPLSPAGVGAPAHDALGCSTDAYLGFQREVMRRVLAVNLAGTFLADMRLALHLEALAESARGSTPRPAAVACRAYGPDGRVHTREVGPLLGDDLPGAGDAAACAACVYDPYCGGPLLGPALMDDAIDERAFGNGYCATSMGTFDAVFELLTSAVGASLRVVFQRWMAAHARIAKRLAA